MENEIYHINVAVQNDLNERRKVTGFTWREILEKGVESAEKEPTKP